MLARHNSIESRKSAPTPIETNITIVTDCSNSLLVSSKTVDYLPWPTLEEGLTTIQSCLRLPAGRSAEYRQCDRHLLLIVRAVTRTGKLNEQAHTATHSRSPATAALPTITMPESSRYLSSSWRVRELASFSRDPCAKLEREKG